MDLTSYSTLMVGYEYLAMDLEMWNWAGKSGMENIRLEVCEGTPVEFENDLKSDKWGNYSQSPDNAGTGLNGHNQTLADWSQGFVNVDLTGLGNAVVSHLVFRIAVTVDEGFENYICDDPILTSNLIDGVALDNVVA